MTSGNIALCQPELHFAALCRFAFLLGERPKSITRGEKARTDVALEIVLQSSLRHKSWLILHTPHTHEYEKDNNKNILHNFHQHYWAINIYWATYILRSVSDIKTSLFKTATFGSEIMHTSASSFCIPAIHATYVRKRRAFAYYTIFEQTVSVAVHTNIVALDANAICGWKYTFLITSDRACSHL